MSFQTADDEAGPGIKMVGVPAPLTSTVNGATALIGELAVSLAFVLVSIGVPCCAVAGRLILSAVARTIALLHKMRRIFVKLDVVCIWEVRNVGVFIVCPCVCFLI